MEAHIHDASLHKLLKQIIFCSMSCNLKNATCNHFLKHEYLFVYPVLHKV